MCVYPNLSHQRYILRDTTMEVVDLMGATLLPQLWALNCTTLGGCRPYGPPSLPQLRAFILHSLKDYQKRVVQCSYM